MNPTDRSGCNLLRARHAQLGGSSDVVEVRFEGRTLEARRGESLLATLVASGEVRLRVTEEGRFRGPFCGMGVCQECLVEVNGRCSMRACMTRVDGAMTVRRQSSRVSAEPRPQGQSTGPQHRATAAINPQIAVIGGGPGGMTAAALAAHAGADVLLIDERSQLGGQYFKQPLAAGDLRPSDFDDRQYEDGRQLIGRFMASGAELMSSARVVGAYEPLDLVVEVGSGTRLVRPQVLIVATGAFEVSYPFDGWTLPGVMTTGAAQTLLRSYRVLPGRRILVAGNGPLNFQFATELLKSGADVAAVIEAAPRPGLTAAGAFAGMMKTDASLAITGLRYLLFLARRGVPRTAPHADRGAGFCSSRAGEFPRAIDAEAGNRVLFLARRGVPLVHGHRIARIDAKGRGDRPRLLAAAECLSGFGSAVREFEVDAVCLGYGFRPSNEVLRALGCLHNMNPNSCTLETERDEDCSTSRENVLAVGDCTRFGGAAAAQAEGIVAAATALGKLGVLIPAGYRGVLDVARARRRRQVGFQQSLWKLFQPAGSLFAKLDDRATVCRCEGLSMAELNTAMSNRPEATLASIKRLTRIGMGRCQGRYCGTTLERIFADRQESALDEIDLWAPRPPIGQTRVADIAGLAIPKQRADE